VGGRLVGSIAEIDALRPKSPVRSGRDRADRGSAATAGRGPRDVRPGDRDRTERVDEERPLPEDLGEMGPRDPGKEDDDDSAPPPPAPPLQRQEMRYK